jgi:type IV secretory pathway TrbF-like protein
MAALLKPVPKHEDELVMFQNQKLWYGNLAGWGVSGIEAIVIGMLVWALIWMRPAPYIFVTNSNGQPIARLQPLLSARAMPEEFVEWELGEFIKAAFSVSPIWDEEQERMDTLKAMATGQAAHALASWYRDGNDPQKVIASAWQDASQVQVLKGTGENEYEASWITTRHSLNDQTATTTNWKATIGIMAVKPSPNNGLGLGVDYFDFSEERK